MMKSFIFALLISIAFPVHAGDLIILEKYRLEKKENKISSMDTEREQELIREELQSKVSNSEDVQEPEWGREIREANSDAQPKINERRNIQNFTIRRIKNKHNIVDSDEDSSLLEYQF
jgi:hypothetical protein